MPNFYRCTACGAKAYEPFCENGCNARMRTIETAPAYRGDGDDDADMYQRDEPEDAMDASLDPHGPWGAP